MKLDDFISQTLTSIILGVKKAQEQTKGAGGAISPHMHQLQKEHSIGVALYHTPQPVSNVEFDVVVSAHDQAETQGGIGIFVGPVGLGSKGASTSNEGTESRIKFKVPILLPYENLHDKS